MNGLDLSLPCYVLAAILGAVFALRLTRGQHGKAELFGLALAAFLGYFGSTSYVKFPERPIVTVNFFSMPNDYREGFEGDGVIWKKNYRPCNLTLKNESKTATIKDIAVSAYLRGYVLSYQLGLSNGATGVQLRHFAPPLDHASQEGEIYKRERAVANNVMLNLLDLSPGGIITVLLVVDPKTVADLRPPQENSTKESAVVDLVYFREGWSNPRVRERFVYRVNEDNDSFKLDSKAILPWKTPRIIAVTTSGVKYSMLLIPD